MDLDGIMRLSGGATFRRADLHIHSYGASPDVKDPTMTPVAIVERAVEEGLEVIALTDHNTIANVQLALEVAKGTSLLVIPAIEVSTSQGHLLLYFPTFEKLSSAVGKLNFSSEGDYCTSSFEDCLSFAAQSDGVGIAAHIQSEAGFMKRVPGHTPVKAGILKHPALFALEILKKDETTIYTSSDSDADRKRHAELRREALGRSEDLPKVTNSDAHSLDRLGHNAADLRRVTRLKMDVLSFDSFRVALLEGSARCRIEDEIPLRVPRLVGISFKGGLLDGQAIRFSSNLTCVIGGRGTGKSTVLESVRAASGSPSGNKIVDSEVGADTVTLWHQDELGKTQCFTRQRGAAYVVNEEDEHADCLFPLETYAQGETAETIQHCGEAPGSLLGFLDRLVDFEDLRLRENDELASLGENSQKILRLARAVSSLGRYRQLAVGVKAKLATLEAEEAGEVIKREAALAQERSIYEELEAQIIGLSIDSTSVERPAILAFISGLPEDEIEVGAPDVEIICSAAKALEARIKEQTTMWAMALHHFKTAAKEAISQWRKKETAERSKIEKKRRELAEKDIKLDMSFIRGLLNSRNEYARIIRDLEEKERELKEARLERRRLLRTRQDIRTKVFGKRQAFAVATNRSLADDGPYRISLKFREGAHSEDVEQLVAGAMGWRTSRIPRAKLLVRHLGIPGLLSALEKKETEALSKVVDQDGIAVFGQREQEELLKMLGEEATLFSIQESSYEDLPQIAVQKFVGDGAGGARSVGRDFSKLSMGQQQSVVLSILLQSESAHPLVIDQPEDNLDGEFIATVLVPHLRRIKERRQVIIVTHNANLAVLADSELVVPLYAQNDSSRVFKPGSIDSTETRDQICRILEGGKPSFIRRGEIYGLIEPKTQ